MKKIIFVFIILALLGLGLFSLLVIKQTNSQFFSRLPIVGQWVTKTFEVTLAPNLSRLDIAQVLARELGWSAEETESFASVYAQMHWMEFSQISTDLFVERFNWGEPEKEAFLVNTSRYFAPEYDFLSKVYLPGTYIVSEQDSKAVISGLLIDRVKESLSSEELTDFVATKTLNPAAEQVANLIKNELELLPDLVPLPAEDLRLRRESGQTFLAFTTVYYNQGRGPLELIADTETAGIASDIERNVFQRIYNSTGGHRDHLAGTFLWHQPHLHYHFEDFIFYDLEAIEAEGVAPDLLEGVKVKSTFCIRDVSRISPPPSGAPDDAEYKICGKEKQGISVGWADAYFYNYPDQSLNVSDLPSGIYRLSFSVNPENSFEEVTKNNNQSSVTFRLDMAKLTVEVLGQIPFDIPKVEHIYHKQENCSNCVL